MGRWYRAYEGTIADGKLHEAAFIAECSRAVVIAVWHGILEGCAATRTPLTSTTPRRLSVVLCEPLATVERVFYALEECGMIVSGRVEAWDRRQFISDQSTDRVRKSRKRFSNGMKRFSNGMKRFRNAPETETETDTKSSLRSDLDTLSSLRSERGRARANRGSRLTQDWMPLPDDLAEAETMLGAEGAKTELAKFRDHWIAQPGARGTKLDWNATWRNWYRRASDFVLKGGSRGNQNLTIAADRLQSGGIAFAEKPGGFRGEPGEDANRPVPPAGRDRP